MTLKEKFTESKGLVGKLLQTHVVMMLFGLMVYLPIGIETENRRMLSLILGIATGIFYYYLIDLYVWDIGAKDAIRARAGGYTLFLGKGFFAGLIAAIPDFILGLLHCIFYINRSYKGFEGLNTVFTLITRTWEGMFVGFERSVFCRTESITETSFVWFYIMTPFIAAAFAGLSYFCGTVEFSIIKRAGKKSK